MEKYLDIIYILSISSWPKQKVVSVNAIDLESGRRLSPAADPEAECESDCVSEAVFMEVWPLSSPESSPPFSLRLLTSTEVTVSFCSRSATTGNSDSKYIVTDI